MYIHTDVYTYTHQGIKDDKFQKILRRRETVENKISKHKLHQSAEMEGSVRMYKRKEAIEAEIVVLKRRVKDSQGMAFR
jgi:hypothetical protein